jgi:hypothetical protein
MSENESDKNVKKVNPTVNVGISMALELEAEASRRARATGKEPSRRELVVEAWEFSRKIGTQALPIRPRIEKPSTATPSAPYSESTNPPLSESEWDQISLLVDVLRSGDAEVIAAITQNLKQFKRLVAMGNEAAGVGSVAASDKAGAVERFIKEVSKVSKAGKGRAGRTGGTEAGDSKPVERTGA